MSLTAARRGRSMADLQALSSKVFSPQEIGAAIAAWKPRPTDVVIAPYGKCGTTWLQQIFHTLRTGGDMDFPDISAVVPWIETATGLGIDINAEQRANPRGFKSHMAHDELPPGAKALVSLRDPKDALVSFYHFMSGWFLEPGAVTLDEFAGAYLERTIIGSYWGHLLSWWKVRHAPNVLLLSYEHMLAEPESAIRRVAAFAGIPLTDELLALTLERSSIQYMLEHKDRFDDALMRQLSETRCNLPPGSDSAKVRKGGAGGHVHEMSPAVSAAMDARWRELVTPITGHPDYAALEADLRAGR
ncbi:MAG: sulfotransferase domain-containing protein [Phenylobacterium sp.]|uniref:sulfotransferase domain-containing protein n=1 Tax=Phenylobacterium sp. TaxID=1871053 RepID=UPI001A519C86|nr:sulfotransferase domain-containing protein [Phenylobacterium sp.]MBL8773921.1 sulfotransferase domain-containing protein [Phenylobacterium sp.]